jgi:hypothetical protein
MRKNNKYLNLNSLNFRLAISNAEKWVGGVKGENVNRLSMATMPKINY